jgi:hypothetical protein
MICDACESWTKSLRDAAETGSEAYLKQTQNVMTDCDTVHELVTSLPTDILEPLAPVVIRKLINMITTYDGSCCELKGAFWYDEDHQITVCSKIFNAALFTCTRAYYTKDISSSFSQQLIIRTLDCVPNLTILAFNIKTEIDNSDLVASNIHHLRNLKSFQYTHHCTDEVVQQLALHCAKLRTVIFTYSYAVTDASVQHLITLNNLEHVSLMFTSITSQLYGTLLSELPNVNNIAIMSPAYDVFQHIPNEELHTITQYVGYIRNINIVTQKCPNLRTATMYGINQNITNMTALTRLVKLQIITGNYEICNLNAVLIGMGHRLRHLHLINIQSVNIVDIVNLCSSLKHLILKACTFVPLNGNAELDTDLPHYRSVTDLKLLENSPPQTDFRHLRHYINLQIFECKGVNILTDGFIEDAMRQGAFRNVLRFWVVETGNGALTMRTVELLLQHCKRLREVGYLGSWRLVAPELISNLRNRIVIMNLNLHIL